MADGDAQEGRLCERAAHAGGPRRSGQVDRSQRRAVPGVRRRRHHAHARPPAYQLAGRQHAEDRNRRRRADAPAAVCARRCSGSGTRERAAGRAHAAGHVGGRVAAVGRRLRRVPRTWRRPRWRAAPLGIAQGRHHEPHGWLAAPQRRAVQPERRHHRVLHAHQQPRRRRLVRRDDGGGGSAVSGSALPHQLELQEGERRVEMETHRMQAG